MEKKYLDELENRLDEDVEIALHQQWLDFCDGKFQGDIFSPRRLKVNFPTIDWPKIRVNDALGDYDLMALQQFSACSDELARGMGALLNVRCNYGTSIIPALFGVDLFIMEPELDTLPTSWPIKGGTDAIKYLLDQGIPDLKRGWGARVLEMGAYFKEMMAPYPKIGRFVHLYHPDFQGPMDIVEVVWGSHLFYDLIDHPDLVKDFLNLVTETYIAFMRAWVKIQPFAGEYSVHWGLMHRGHLMLRDDSAMNLSPAMFMEFIEPYDRRLLAEFGGGAIHFCGKGDHFIHRFPEIPGVYAVNLSQPEYNRMETIFINTVDQNISILGLARPAAEHALNKGLSLRGKVHCW